jgi:type VI secretion system protein
MSASSHRAACARAVLLLLLALCASGCSFTRWIDRCFGGDIKMNVSVADDLNNNSPVAVEVLFLYDEGQLEALSKQTAQDWFKSRDQFVKDNANKPPGFDHWKWEWVPGQAVPVIPLSYRIGARGGVIFVSYNSAGTHRAMIDPRANIQLSLGTREFTVAQHR